MSRVYKLSRDYGHSGDKERDAFHLPFEGDQKIMYYFSNPTIYGKELLPKEIYFRANFNVIPEYDYPLTDLLIPIMSVRMLNTLRTISRFNYDEIPVVMLDDTYSKGLFDDMGMLAHQVSNLDTYKAVRLSALEAYFDYEKSVYRPSRSNPDQPGVIKKVVLKEPLSGFPALFSVDILSPDIFVSEKAKEALEASNIKGCVFEEVEVS